MDNSTVVDWSAVTNQYLRLLNWTQSWSANPPILDLPSEWLDSTYWSNILAANNNTENLWKLLDVFSNINKMLKDTNEWQVLIDMLNTGQLIADTMDKLLAKMEIQNGEVNIGSMFKNSTAAESFLAGIDGLDQQLIEGLISGLLKPSKVNMNRLSLTFFLASVIGVCRIVESFPFKHAKAQKLAKKESVKDYI